MGAYVVAGGLECWDRRRPGKPQLRSPISWDSTGNGAMDAVQVAGIHLLFSV